MHQIPVALGSFQIGFGSVFVPDVSLGFAVWLGVAALAYLTLLPVALRHGAPEPTAIEPDPITLREAA